MKSPFVKGQTTDELLETALRRSPREVEFPDTLHHSIMRAVRAADREGRHSVSGRARFHRFIRMRWIPVTELAGIFLLGVLLSVHNRPKPTVNAESLTPISAAFTARQEVVDALPSLTVGPLSEELDKVNQDIDRTAEFLLATLP